MDISVDDLNMMYKGSVVMWKGSPVLVQGIDGNYKVSVWDLENQKFKNLSWIPDNFTAPSVRIGYINLGTNCVYVHRIPVRKYKVGLHYENINQVKQEHPLNRNEQLEARKACRELSSLSLYKALMNIYPSMEEAAKTAVEQEAVVAFDKQFAVSYDHIIYYKGKRVGVYEAGRILFDIGHDHLNRALISS